jgi:hypothetical protein
MTLGEWRRVCGRGQCPPYRWGITLVILLALVRPAVADEPVFRPEAVRWVPFASEPLFAGTGVATWDNRIRERGFVHREGNLWRLWYTGYDGTKTGIRRLGLALSTDGIAWTRADRAPLIDDLWVEDVNVLVHEGRFQMVAEGLADRAQRLSSADGRHWTRHGPLDVRLATGQPIPEGPYGTPTVWFEDGVWNLFYERKDLGIWLARSTDLVVWTNVRDEPLLVPGPHAYDREALAFSQILKIGDRYTAVLHGTGSQAAPRLWNTYFAWSTNLIDWTKAETAIFPESENKSSGQLIHDGQDWRLYTLHDRVIVHKPLK